MKKIGASSDHAYAQLLQEQLLLTRVSLGHYKSGLLFSAQLPRSIYQICLHLIMTLTVVTSDGVVYTSYNI
jgi:hypothetical protein